MRQSVGAKRPSAARSGVRDAPSMWLAVACAVIVGALPGLAEGQQAPADVFAALEGRWTGTGTLLGRLGAFEMEWETRSGGFVRLSFSNGWVGPDGETQPVMNVEWLREKMTELV